MLRCDRYVVAASGAYDLATGNPVVLARVRSMRRAARLFQVCGGRTLIDVEPLARGRLEIWEPWCASRRAAAARRPLHDFLELLECARYGVPRVFDPGPLSGPQAALLTRVAAREARLRGWVPIALHCLAPWVLSGDRRRQSAIDDRSLVIFATGTSVTAAAIAALLRLSERDLRPHVVVRLAADGAADRESIEDAPMASDDMVREQPAAFGGPAGPTPPDLAAEARARWALLIERLGGGRRQGARTVDLAAVLAARGQLFEARALLAADDRASPDRARHAARLTTAWDRRERIAAAERLDAEAQPRGARGWEMVDDFVSVLQLCQDVEDEQVALSRVGAFLRERLQASSVAFVARDGAASRVLARVGSEVAGIDLALRSIETGAPIHPPRRDGPTESACPVRHAAEVIGAVWCRWSAGMPVAGPQAATLLGVAAAAAAPSLRLAIARAEPAAARGNPVPELVGESQTMRLVREAIVRAAGSPFPVVIEGESGSGKELAARAIHARSARRERRFCAINCAALVDELVEAELFGHVRGAFTSAATDRPGVFEEANGGILFLDEVAELGARVQAKLLRALQEGEIRRLGETAVRKVDIRVVAATNRPLAHEVQAGAFRADLWYRLDVIRLTMPPLRERLEDLPALVQHLWRTLAARTGSRASLSAATVATLAAYDWPGNIRELQNVLASLLVATPRGGVIGPSALPAHVARIAAIDRAATLAAARRRFEERYVRAALARAGGRTAAAARELGLSRQGLSKLMGRLGIDAGRPESASTAHVQ